MPSSPLWKIVTKPQYQHWQCCVNIFFNKCLKKKYQHCDLVFIKELILCKCILILLVFTHLYTLTGDICCFHSFKKLLPNRSCCSRLPWIPSHPFPPLKNLVDFFSILVVHCTILLTCIPVQKSLPAEHCCELLRNSLENFLKHKLW